MTRRAAFTIADLPAVQPGAKVKPLWWRGDSSHFFAFCQLGEYHISLSTLADPPGRYRLRLPFGAVQYFDTLEAAKAAAQADYEARILAALTPQPVATALTTTAVADSDRPEAGAKVAGLVEAANKAAIVLAEHEPHPLPVLIELLTALAALEDRG